MSYIKKNIPEEFETLLGMLLYFFNI
jgi:hypothetical protein